MLWEACSFLRLSHDLTHVRSAHFRQFLFLLCVYVRFRTVHICDLHVPAHVSHNTNTGRASLPGMRLGLRFGGTVPVTPLADGAADLLPSVFWLVAARAAHASSRFSLRKLNTLLYNHMQFCLTVFMFLIILYGSCILIIVLLRYR